MLRNVLSKISNSTQRRRCHSTQPQQLAKQIREHFQTLDSNIWKTSPSPITNTGWSAFLSATNVLSSSDADFLNSKAQLTAMLTYPITLAWLLDRTPKYSSAKSLNIHIIGARAEAMFPDWIWKMQSDIYQARNQHVSIDLIGPMVPNLGSQNNTKQIGNVQITHHPGALYHNIEHDLAPADMYVAFHPGWGQKEWQPSWKPTLEKIIQNIESSEGQNSELYFSSFDNNDMKDDMKFIRELNSTCAMTSYAHHPFASELTFPHSEGETRMIAQNQTICGFNAEKPFLSF